MPDQSESLAGNFDLNFVQSDECSIDISLLYCSRQLLSSGVITMTLIMYNFNFICYSANVIFVSANIKSFEFLCNIHVK